MLLGIANAASLGVVGVLLVLVLGQLLFDRYEADADRALEKRNRADRGAVAEERIGSDLTDLGEDFFVMNDVASPYGNVDHIVISRIGGVFLIETKAHGGKVSIRDGYVLVNGRTPERNFVAQTLKNTYWLRDEIRATLGVEVWVTPTVVFTNAFVEQSEPVKGVQVINERYLPTVLHRRNWGPQYLTVWENRAKIRQALCA